MSQHRSHPKAAPRKTPIAGFLLLTLACAGSPEPPVPLDDEDLGTLVMPLLASNCAITATGMTAQVADGETAVLRLRPADGKVVLNARTSTMAPCEVPATGATIQLSAWGTTAALGRSVILDYIEGLFTTAAAGTSLVVDFTVASNGSNDTLKIRATQGNDSFVFGTAAGVATSVLNHNAGSDTGQDSFNDVTFRQIEKVIVAALGGDDVISGAGGFGSAAPTTSGLRLFGGTGDDTLTGGSGADTIRGGAGNDTMDGVLGSDTIVMQGSGDGNDVVECTGTPTGSDTVDYSVRTTDLVLNLDGTANSGELGENDTLSAKIANVIAGAGNDAITIDATSTVNHTVSGGAGDDGFIGSAASIDVFDGQGGDDACAGDTSAMTYASRSTAVTVTTCDPGGDCSMDADDGDQTLTTTRKSGTAAAAADDGMTNNDIVTITSLTGITTADIGRKIRLSGFQTSATNDATTGYTITAQTATSVTISVASNASFDESSLTAASAPAGLTWSIVGAEKDNVTCGQVIGSPQADTITGDARNNVLRGGAGNDVLSGGAGNDFLYGDAGNDQLWAGAGEDNLNGGDGDDSMAGGDDDDFLRGDAGTDTFVCDGANVSGGANGSSPGTGDTKADVDVGESADVDCDL
ncbi:MAG TPA: calcium-binding protein [Polyangia bacterium]